MGEAGCCTGTDGKKDICWTTAQDCRSAIEYVQADHWRFWGYRPVRCPKCGHWHAHPPFWKPLIDWVRGLL